MEVSVLCSLFLLQKNTCIYFRNPLTEPSPTLVSSFAHPMSFLMLIEQMGYRNSNQNVMRNLPTASWIELTRTVDCLEKKVFRLNVTYVGYHKIR